MIDVDDVEFVSALRHTAEVFKEPMSPERFEGYFQALQDLPIEQVKLALLKIEKTAEFFPRSPVVIRRQVESAPTVEEAAEHAWQRFRWAMQHVTVYDAVDFNDPALSAAVVSLFGGWPQTGDIQSAKMSYVRMDFLKAYKASAVLGLTGDAVLYGIMRDRPPVKVPANARPVALVPVPELAPPVVRRGLSTSEPVPIAQLLPGRVVNA